MFYKIPQYVYILWRELGTLLPFLSYSYATLSSLPVLQVPYRYIYRFSYLCL